MYELFCWQPKFHKIALFLLKKNALCNEFTSCCSLFSVVEVGINTFMHIALLLAT